ncbi:zinc finger protein 347-like isoform X2 [Macrosteles quadrilineatus]|uniref:zinc finger protein 347-like isoform X2 n=1 Tax=Macrosteles quadrilineatus TaxID=74068 RepID=UPI0023E2AFE3|nr:zinc finger protein 347-like isoform X2 [Macrosteles quadrilineatus]XP_054282994.1 zinc finger protein 347-like isoform X2 [Macrosteles quadrilineatus]
MNHIAQYRNGLHQIHHNPCPPIHNFTGRFPSPNLGPLPDNVMIPQIVAEGTIQYHNGPLQPFLSTPDNRAQQQQQQQNDDSSKVSSHRKQTMSIRSFQTVQTPIIATPTCSTQQEPPPKAAETGSCNDNNYKPPQTSNVDNHQFVQHCDQGPKSCVQCYNLLKGETSGPVIKVMVDAATMTDQDEMDQTGNWSVVSNSSPPPNTKVTEYLSSLRQFLKVDQKPHESRKQRQGDVRIVTSPDGTRLYFCPECHAAYPDKNLLEPHLAAHKIERRFICNVCGAGLKRKEHLDRHQLSHSDERPYSCGVCSKTFKRNEHLSRHSIIHSGLKAQDRPWVCGVCGTGHARKEHLERHQVTHSDVRPHACPACPKMFKRNEHLTRHLVIHSGQKTELCRECGKTFYRKDHLRKHAESHHKKRTKQMMTQPMPTQTLPMLMPPPVPSTV